MRLKEAEAGGGFVWLVGPLIDQAKGSKGLTELKLAFSLFLIIRSQECLELDYL